MFLHHPLYLIGQAVTNGGLELTPNFSIKKLWKNWRYQERICYKAYILCPAMFSWWLCRLWGCKSPRGSPGSDISYLYITNNSAWKMFVSSIFSHCFWQIFHLHVFQTFSPELEGKQNQTIETRTLTFSGSEQFWITWVRTGLFWVRIVLGSGYLLRTVVLWSITLEPQNFLGFMIMYGSAGSLTPTREHRQNKP